jgi:hypothetical protein
MMMALNDNVKVNYMLQTFTRFMALYGELIVTVFLLVNLLILILFNGIISPELAAFTVSFTYPICL